MKNSLLIAIAFLYLTFDALAQKSISRFDEVVIISTTEGEMVVLLFDETPKHKENFLKLAKSGFYDGTTFHRIIPEFMIQGGDPNSKDSVPDNDGMGGPGYTLPNEINFAISHSFGRLAAARMGDGVNPQKESSGSQFYIVQNHKGTPHLDNAYTVFGQVIEGLEVIDKIASQPKNYSDRPDKNITVTMKVKKMKRKKIDKKLKAMVTIQP